MGACFSLPKRNTGMYCTVLRSCWSAHFRISMNHLFLHMLYRVYMSSVAAVFPALLRRFKTYAYTVGVESKLKIKEEEEKIKKMVLRG